MIKIPRGALEVVLLFCHGREALKEVESIGLKRCANEVNLGIESSQDLMHESLDSTEPFVI